MRPPSPAARLSYLDESVLAGVDARLFRDGSLIGVVAPDEDDLGSYLRAAPHEDLVLLDEPPAAPVVRTLRAEYPRPFTAHASVAPNCAIGCWDGTRSLSVWSPSQGINRLRDALAQAFSLEPTAVEVEHSENAGAYGHNCADDAAFDAALLARAVPGVPVQLQWSRQDELTWAGFGSAMTSEVMAGLDGGGRIVSWQYDVWSKGHTDPPSYSGVPGFISGDLLAAPLDRPPAGDPPHKQGGGTTRNAVPIYEVAGRRITGHRLLEAPLRSTALRALGAFHNVFSTECFIDELALEVGEDALDFRLRHLDDPRATAVLEAAAAGAGWGSSSPRAAAAASGWRATRGEGRTVPWSPRSRL